MKLFNGKEVNLFWQDHPVVQRLIGFIPGTNERVESYCRSCGADLKNIDGDEGASLCGNCG